MNGVYWGHMHFAHQHVWNGILHFTPGSFSQNDGHEEPTTEYVVAEIIGDVISTVREGIQGHDRADGPR